MLDEVDESMDHFDINTLMTRLIKKSVRSSPMLETFHAVMSMNSKKGQLIYRDMFPHYLPGREWRLEYNDRNHHD